MTTVTQNISYRQALIPYAEKYEVTWSAIRYKTNRQYILPVAQKIRRNTAAKAVSVLLWVGARIWTGGFAIKSYFSGLTSFEITKTQNGIFIFSQILIVRKRKTDAAWRPFLFGTPLQNRSVPQVFSKSIHDFRSVGRLIPWRWWNVSLTRYLPETWHHACKRIYVWLSVTLLKLNCQLTKTFFLISSWVNEKML